jgi:hypothetical protein
MRRRVCHDGKPPGFLREAGWRERGKFFPQPPVRWRPDANTSSCLVEFDGIPNANHGKIYGADSIQALQLAVDIEPMLKHLSKLYDFYFPSGEGYFDE